MTRQGRESIRNAQKSVSNDGRGQFWLTRIVFLRCLGFIYLVAFLVALNDNEALLGENGLLPATRYMSRLRGHFDRKGLSAAQRLLEVPTLFWLLPPTATNLSRVAGVGAGVSAVVAMRGAANLPMMALLWGLYHSIVNVGQTWYSFGWESQLLETGFLAMFLVPWVNLSRFPAGVPTPPVCVWGYRWLLFRVMLGAGLIKVRGDQCWRDLTCMDYHYETQPNPNPLSLYAHHLPPASWHKFEVLVNHVVELVVPWGLLLTRRVRAVSGLVQVLFQVALVISGNLSFLNWLTALPAVFAFDDAHLGWLFLEDARRRARIEAAWFEEWREATGSPTPETSAAGAGTAERDHPPPDVGDRSSRSSRDGAPHSREALPETASASRREGLDGAALAHQERSNNLRRRRDNVGVDETGTKEPGASGLAGREQRQEERGWARSGEDELWRRRRRWLRRRLSVSFVLRSATHVLLLVLVVKGSVPVLKNLAGKRQLMNTSFDSLRIVNTYGAFGSITKERGEVVLKGTRHHDPFDPAADWREYEFKCKPGGVDKRPCIITPFHYRLDWQMWFAAFQSYSNNPWLVSLVAKLLSRDSETRALVGQLLQTDPFAEEGGEGGMGARAGAPERGGPPRFIRADYYRYRFTEPTASAEPGLHAAEAATTPTQDAEAKARRESRIGEQSTARGADVGAWWTRRLMRQYLPPLSLDNESMKHFLQSYGLE